ncbi:MAG: methylenetetrahydrofolate reductase [Alistipes sp.]|nr:methylenetetrahydrofolate reductase [Alistipes sp.]
MRIRDIIEQSANEGRFRFSCEMLPPLKGDGTDGVFAAVDNIMEFEPAWIDITFHRETLSESIGADGRRERHTLRRRPGTVGISAAIRSHYGVEVVPHLICGGLSRYDIEDALIDMDFLGLHNVLALRGDKSPHEERFTPHPQGHSRAVELLRQIMDMNRGRFVDGLVDECHHSTFSAGVAGYPEVHSDALSAEEDILHLKEKVDAGADYVITQLFFDNDKFFDFRRRCREAGIEVPIIPGIKPLSTIRHLEILPATFGTGLPDDLISEVRRHAGDPAAVRAIGTEWCTAQCRGLKEAGIPVVHLYTMSRTDQIAEVLGNVM